LTSAGDSSSRPNIDNAAAPVAECLKKSRRFMNLHLRKDAPDEYQAPQGWRPHRASCEVDNEQFTAFRYSGKAMF